ncbi:hypothetical protein DLM_3207 [Aquitalea magnusonii]|uniref:Uncharacterized protein n=1 Tax=Aquitalea magnusonii TaxID=332411 RepID=A0A3G9GJE3_9NEIS|nr:hypothetical protein DLM_3207 [Aquitalea magnusonii]
MMAVLERTPCKKPGPAGLFAACVVSEAGFLRQFPPWVSIRMEASASLTVRPQQNSHETRIS